MLALVAVTLFVSGASGECDVSSQHKTLEVKAGDDAVLPCCLGPPFDKTASRVEWTHKGKDVHLYRKGKDVLDDQDMNFKGRTSLFHDEMIRGNISLKLSQANKQDVGNYACHVKVKDSDQVKQCDIYLGVKRESSTDNSAPKNRLPPNNGHHSQSQKRVAVECKSIQEKTQPAKQPRKRTRTIPRQSDNMGNTSVSSTYWYVVV